MTKLLNQAAVVMAVPAALALIKLRYWPVVQAVSASMSRAPRYCLTRGMRPTNSSPWKKNYQLKQPH